MSPKGISIHLKKPSHFISTTDFTSQVEIGGARCVCDTFGKRNAGSGPIDIFDVLDMISSINHDVIQQQLESLPSNLD
jgi:hypothetical protein